jgi:hypothetical protein
MMIVSLNTVERYRSRSWAIANSYAIYGMCGLTSNSVLVIHIIGAALKIRTWNQCNLSVNVSLRPIQ